MTDKEAMKLALDALKEAQTNNDGMEKWDRNKKAIIALEEALAQPEQEPVAWQVEVYINGGWSPMGNPQLNKSRAEALASNPSLPKEKQRIVELYATPPQRTEQEPVSVELPCCGYTDASAVKWNPFNGVVQCHNCGQTYTPPQRKPLTDYQIQRIWDVASGALPGWSRHIAYARAIEAAHGIKENT
jgi:hypothetical protein